MLNKRRYFLLVSISLISVLILVSCANVNAENGSSTTTGYGEVTEITMVTTIEASGSITPRQVASVTWSTSGIVGSVNVEVGQQVKMDEILMTLEQDSVSSTVRNSQIKLQEMTSQSAISEAEQAVLDAQSELDDAVYALTYLDYVDEGIINNAYAEYIIANEKYEDAYENYEELDDELEADDPELAQAYTVLYQAKQDMENLEYVYNLYSNHSKSSDQTYAEYKNAVTLAENTLLQAEYYLAAIKGEEIPSDFTSSALNEFYDLQESIDAINLRAPFDGMVGVIDNEPGILVSGNQTGADLIDRSKLFLTISVDESDYLLLSTGLTGVVTVDVFPENEYSAQIDSINPVGQVSNSVVYYDVTLEIDQVDDSIPINASASVEIDIGEPETQLLVPATAVQSDTEGEYVQVVRNGSIQRVNVVSGTIMSDDTVVVAGDLEVGEQVVLVVETSSDEDEETNNGMFGGLFDSLLGGGAGGDTHRNGGEMPSGREMPAGGGMPNP